jgi:ankyrin repeat protein
LCLLVCLGVGIPAVVDGWQAAISKPTGAGNIIFAFVSHGDSASLQQYLPSYPQGVNIRDAAGYTPLLLAARLGRVQIAEILLAAHADPNARVTDANGATALHLAIANGYTDMVTLLLQHGADVNAPARNSLTPLHLCAAMRHPDILRVLLAHHANLATRAKDSSTPLELAIKCKQAENVAILKRVKR